MCRTELATGRFPKVAWISNLSAARNGGAAAKERRGAGRQERRRLEHAATRAEPAATRGGSSSGVISVGVAAAPVDSSANLAVRCDRSGAPSPAAVGVDRMEATAGKQLLSLFPVSRLNKGTCKNSFYYLIIFNLFLLVPR